MVVSLLGPARAQSLGAARILEQAGQFERALSEYEAALVQRPGDMEAYEGFERVCRQLARFDSLEAVSARLSRIAPEEPRFAIGRIDGLLGLKRKKDALALCRSVVEKWPEQAVAVADVLERWKEPGEATTYLLMARQSQGSDRLYADRLIALYELQDRYAEATREIVLLVDAQSDLLQAYLGKLREFVRKAGASHVLAELSKLRDPWPKARAEAEVYLALGKEAEALKVVRQVMDRDGLYGFAHECEDEGAFAAALAVYQEQGLRADQARVLRKLGRNKEALALLSQDQNPDALFELAEIYRLETKDFQAAAGNYERVLKAKPGDEPAAFGLASSQLGLGQLEQARKTLGLARSQTDRVLLLLAKVFLYRLDLDSAKYFGQELVRKHPGSPLSNDGLEIALLSSGGDRALELAKAMYEAETQTEQKALERCEALGKGKDDVAEQAWFLRAQILRDAGQAKPALAVLDSFALLFPQSPRRPRQLLEQADIFSRDLKDENMYRQALEDIAVSFPGSPYAPVARSLLAEANRPAGPEIVR